MEEIDIIELLKRVKEGKAPKRLYIEDYGNYTFDYDNMNKIKLYYVRDDGQHWYIEDFILDNKIKILDKPIIEELDYSLEELEDTSYNESWLMNCIRANKEKINEIIKFLNNKEE